MTHRVLQPNDVKQPLAPPATQAQTEHLVHGVGPIFPFSTDVEQGSESESEFLRPRGSLVTALQVKRSTSTATDVWYFMRALVTAVKPSALPPGDGDDHLKTRPDARKFIFLGCRLCV